MRYYYNKILLYMINRNNRYKEEVLQEFKERIFPCMDNTQLDENILRVLCVIILRSKKVEEKVLVDYYTKCCEHNVYAQFDVSLSSSLFFLHLWNFVFSISRFKIFPLCCWIAMISINWFVEIHNYFIYHIIAQLSRTNSSFIFCVSKSHFARNFSIKPLLTVCVPPFWRVWSSHRNIIYKHVGTYICNRFC